MIQKKKLLVLLAGLVVIVVAFLPHLQNGMFLGSDDFFHYHRIISVADAIKNGIFPVKIHFIAAYGYGYGVGFFYSNALLYIPAVLISFFGLSLPVAYKIFVFLLYAAIFCATYYSIRKLTGRGECAFFAASILLFSNKVMESFYQTIAIGQMSAFIFIPMAIIGMYLFLEREEKPYLLIGGFVGLIFSHTISTFLTFIVCLLLVMIYQKRLWNKPGRILHLATAVVIVTAITAIYWLPMLEQMKAQLMKVKAPWTTSEQNVSSLGNLITGRTGMGYIVFLLFILSMIMTIQLLHKKKSFQLVKGEMVFLTIAIGMGLLTTFYPFWHFMNTTLNIKLIQFPCRLNMIVTILIITAFAMLYSKMEFSTRSKWVGGVVLIGMSMIASFIEFSPSFLQIDNSHIETVINGEIAGLGAGEEWLPMQTDREELVDSTMAMDNEGNRVIGKKESGNRKYIFQADLSKEYYDVPYVWYKGYRAVDSKGNRLEINQNRDTGMIQVYMPENGHGTEEIIVYYTETKYQKLAYLGSAIGIAMLLIYWQLDKKKYSYRISRFQR